MGRLYVHVIMLKMGRDWHRNQCVMTKSLGSFPVIVQRRSLCCLIHNIDGYEVLTSPLFAYRYNGMIFIRTIIYRDYIEYHRHFIRMERGRVLSEWNVVVLSMQLSTRDNEIVLLTIRL